MGLDPRFDNSIDRMTGFVTKSLLATPIQWHGKLLGVLEVINKRSGSKFSEDDERLLEIVANQATITVENSRLIEPMVQSEQLSAVGKMTVSIVQDFGGPLSVIRGYAGLLAESDISPNNRVKFSDLILEDVDHFLGMSQEFLDYSKGTINLKSKPVKIEGLLEKLATSMKDRLEGAKVRLKTDIRFEGEVLMDEPKVRRVELNIAGNAVDAMPEGGGLTIVVDVSEDKCRLSMTDTGHGIPVEIRSRIFDPFVTKGKDYGTGLGLAVAKEIVEGHGGSLDFETRTSS